MTSKQKEVLAMLREAGDAYGQGEMLTRITARNGGTQEIVSPPAFLEAVAAHMGSSVTAIWKTAKEVQTRLDLQAQ